MKRFNIFGFITFYGILFLIILYKVLNVPVTTDEVPTFFFYSKFSVWEIMMYPDNIPNNHILNTILVKCCLFIFGNDQWVIRLPNLLVFLFFSVAVFHILSSILGTHSLFFLPGAILFVNPYLLDFFGICRGYGISTTMVTITILFLISGYTKRKQIWIWLALLTSILASYANFTSLVFWASMVILVWLFFLIDNYKNPKKLIKPTIIIFIISLIYLAIIAVPVHKMQSTDQFKFWSSGGFYNDTILSLVNEWRYNSDILSKINGDLIVIVFAIIFTLNVIHFIKTIRIKKVKPESFFDLNFITIALLLLPVITNILQTVLLGTPNLKGRTALFFYPLISTTIIVVVKLIPEFKKIKTNRILLGFILVCLIFNTFHRISLISIKEWYYDQNTIEVINYLKDNGSKDKPVSLKTNWIFHPSFYFYYDSGKTPWIDLQPYDYNLDVNTPSQYYYIFADDYKFLEPRFRVVYKFAPDRWLLKQR